MADATDNQASRPVTISNEDETRIVTVEQDTNGKNRMFTNTAISSVQIPLGKDPLPDTFFRAKIAGAIGDKIIIDIAATTFDTTSPDANYPAYHFEYVLVAGDVGNEKQLSLNFADAINADPLFEAQDLEAEAVSGKKRSIIHITSIEFSLSGEENERPNIGDFLVTTIGTTLVIIGDAYRNIISRPKEVSLGRDPNNPHALGVQAISGTIFIRSSDPDAIIRDRIEEVGIPGQIDLNVDGDPVNRIFEYTANAKGGPDIVIDSIKLFGNDGNIKTQVTNFLGINSALANGLLVEFIRDGLTIFSENITNTVEFLGQFSSTSSDNKIINQSGGDYIESTFSLIAKNLAFVLRNGENDLVRVTVRDDIDSVGALYMLIDGSEDV